MKYRQLQPGETRRVLEKVAGQPAHGFFQTRMARSDCAREPMVSGFTWEAALDLVARCITARDVLAVLSRLNAWKIEAQNFDLGEGIRGPWFKCVVPVEDGKKVFECEVSPFSAVEWKQACDELNAPATSLVEFA